MVSNSTPLALWSTRGIHTYSFPCTTRTCPLPVQPTPLSVPGPVWAPCVETKGRRGGVDEDLVSDVTQEGQGLRDRVETEDLFEDPPPLLLEDPLLVVLDDGGFVPGPVASGQGEGRGRGRLGPDGVRKLGRGASSPCSRDADPSPSTLDPSIPRCERGRGSRSPGSREDRATGGWFQSPKGPQTREPEVHEESEIFQ